MNKQINIFTENTTNSLTTAHAHGGSYYIGEQRMLRRACASAQARLSFRCSLAQYRELVEAKSHISGPVD